MKPTAAALIAAVLVLPALGNLALADDRRDRDNQRSEQRREPSRPSPSSPPPQRSERAAPPRVENRPALQSRERTESRPAPGPPPQRTEHAAPPRVENRPTFQPRERTDSRPAPAPRIDNRPTAATPAPAPAPQRNERPSFQERRDHPMSGPVQRSDNRPTPRADTPATAPTPQRSDNRPSPRADTPTTAPAPQLRAAPPLRTDVRPAQPQPRVDSATRHRFESRGSTGGEFRRAPGLQWRDGDHRTFDRHDGRQEGAWRVSDRDRHRWHDGHWVHGYRGSRFGWWWVIGPAWYLYDAPVYPYPDPEVPIVIYDEPQVADVCRVFNGDAIINDTGEPFYGTACLQADGQWHIVPN